jgi:hypothetical protein
MPDNLFVDSFFRFQPNGYVIRIVFNFCKGPAMQGDSNLEHANPQSPTPPLSPIAHANKVLAFGTESLGMLNGM